MDVRTDIIEDFSQIIEIGITFKKNWFRGHSKLYGELIPGIFRDRIHHQLYQDFKPELEFELYSEFIRKAPSYTSNHPEPNSYLEWLFLMQHHGMPTRLLDWTENILVAAYFAVSSNDGKEGEIWSFLPWRLNETTVAYGIPTHSSKHLQFYYLEPFRSDEKELAEELNLEEIPKAPLAFLPTLAHPRLTSQQSAFTIHRSPEEGQKIEEVIEDERDLVRYVIPQSLKKKFRHELDSLGINRGILFPDLDGLAKTFRDNLDRFSWGQPQPLDFKAFTPDALEEINSQMSFQKAIKKASGKNPPKKAE